MTASLDRLLAIMARLRDPERGCPWDCEQNFATIAPYTIEEAYEVADAIARADHAALQDELGDLLFQVVFHARMAEEAGLFAFDDVAGAIADKMTRRHPHVFGDAVVASAAAQSEAWEAHKAGERRTRAAAAGRRESVLDGVALALPALTRAAKIQRRAARLGFDWPAVRPVIAKIAEEIAELEAELGGDKDPARIDDELGDLLFAAVNLARKLEIDPEAALCRATAKFERRFRRVETLAAERGVGRDLDALEDLWQEIKRGERAAPQASGSTDMGRAKAHPYVRIEQVLDELPAGVERLAAEALAEGYGNIDRLATEWHTGEMRFAGEGEALFAALADEAVIGIGGVTLEPVLPGALRMRRFYVAAGFRRRGIARRLAQALLDQAQADGRWITVNAATGSEAFWRSLGFLPDRRDGHTHLLRARSAILCQGVNRDGGGGAGARHRPTTA
jgi:MazG family protein